VEACFDMVCWKRLSVEKKLLAGNYVSSHLVLSLFEMSSVVSSVVFIVPD